MDKPALFAAFRAHLQARLDQLLASQDEARSGTRVDGVHRPSNRGERAAVTSQAYLAHGLGQRAQELQDLLALLDRIPADPRDRVTTGALVEILDENDVSSTILVIPGGEGARLPGEVRALSPDAPLARALWGSSVGAVATVIRAGRSVEVEIVSIA